MIARERDGIALAALAGAAVCGYLWLVLALAGLIFGGGWPRISLLALLTGIAHWLAHPAQPAAGFPPALRARLPGPLGVYGTLLGLSATLAALVLCVHRGCGSLTAHARCLATAAARALGVSQGHDGEGARWAKPSELRALAVSRPQPGRLTIGRCGSRLIAVERRHSLLVVGPTQSGKTSALAIPALLEWHGPALCTSVKHDLLGHTEAARAARGPVWVYDPAPYAERESARFNPLGHCRSWHGARRMAQWLSDAAQSLARRRGAVLGARRGEAAGAAALRRGQERTDDDRRPALAERARGSRGRALPAPGRRGAGARGVARVAVSRRARAVLGRT